MRSGIRRVDRSFHERETRQRYWRAGLIALFGNFVLVAVKGYGAWQTGSRAIYADAANSASDVAYSLMMMVGLWYSLQPPDPGHPHGHERIEPLVSLAIAATMVFAGVDASRQGLRGWTQSLAPTLSARAISIPIASSLIKVAMYWVVRNLGRAAQSPAILASAKDNLLDALSSGTALLGVVSSIYLYPRADAVAALLVAAWIFFAAWTVLRESIGHLIGGSPSLAETEWIEKAVVSVPQVLGIDQIIAEYVGPKLRVDIHIYVDPTLQVSEAHGVSHAVRSAVESNGLVDHAFVHVEPLPDGE